ncbi:MAG: hypothetical protein A3G32_02020 [Deltaproteobacteria bacterium RIFCSPLOWO2_12_FULL_40_28]|nr:MAG: hypothetical protein A3C45_04325 [Deltaproteobacteria bacterium RIFCSPHIGHO2_02_FULL_40_28]OGQ21109.1 MAG: hypothetical protein A3E27_05085 [Deltaproteobacteria bacterium RIFCSPHIGHO2_12_FULL_40_32]OGQ39026.1 MAG: hypothetical protein A3I69_06750 [Deltaproteobacteria bacterium RIFCSPLOWO2_02_FULL_40_36]OGQ53074.1 MAG: hypothetical protein A3G32_02020 [Deltaproteobacteria bacterium RIFCSPLOWO2_12_FULL_40_28]
MKTTIDISNSLFKEIKTVAQKKDTTFREIVETSLRLFLSLQKKTTKNFKLKNNSFKGNGLAEGLEEGDWSSIRKRAYEGRGG